MKKEQRIWLDTVVLTFVSKETLEALINTGHTLVIANTAIDVAVFQENINWFEKQLATNHVVIEIWNTPDEMTTKTFYWSSCSQLTSPAESLEEAVKNLPNAENILSVAKLVNTYGIPKGSWPMGQWAAPLPLSADIAQQLHLNEGATRTDVLAAAQKLSRMDLFDKFNMGYVAGLAKQHTCTAILNSDGTITEI